MFVVSGPCSLALAYSQYPRILTAVLNSMSPAHEHSRCNASLKLFSSRPREVVFLAHGSSPFMRVPYSLRFARLVVEIRVRDCATPSSRARILASSGVLLVHPSLNSTFPSNVGCSREDLWDRFWCLSVGEEMILLTLWSTRNMLVFGLRSCRGVFLPWPSCSITASWWEVFLSIYLIVTA